MTRGRKLSASSIRERVEKILGVDDNPYGLPPLTRNLNSNNKLFCIQDPSRIPVIGKLLLKPKHKFTRRRRSSSLPARYQAIYAENPPDVEILPEHFEDFDKREKAFYEQYPHLRPCMTAEEFDEEFAKWDAKCNIRHLKKKPPKLYRWERQFGSRELLNPRRAPRPPGFVERPISKALPPLPPDSGDRSTCDTEFLISQFPPAPDTIPPLSGKPSVANARQPIQRQRSGSEGTKPREDAAMRWCLGVKFDPNIRSPLSHKDDESYAGKMTRPALVYYVQEHEVLLPPSRGRVRSRQAYITPMAQATQTTAGFVNMFHTLETNSSDTAQPAGVATTSMIAAELTAWGEEIAREEVAREAARAEALRKLESNQIQSQAPPPQPQVVHHERKHHKNDRMEPTQAEETKDRQERERKNGDEHQRQVEKERQRQRLKSEPKPRHGPSSSPAGVQEKDRERQPHEENRRRKPSGSRPVDVTRMPQDERNKREHKSEKEHHRERNKSEPKRHVPPSSGSVAAQEKRRERHPEDNARARVESKTQDNTRKHVVRRSVSTSTLRDMSKSQIVYIPPPAKADPQRHANAGAPPTVMPPAHELPSLPITPITPSNIGVRAAAAAPAGTPAAQGHAPAVIRPRPSRPNLGPPPSLSSGSAQRSRAPSLTQRSAEKPPALTERLVGAVLHRKASNSSFDHKPIDKSSISAPVKHIKGAETGLFQLRHAQLYVQELQVTMIPLPYQVQYPPTPESIAPRAKPTGAESGDGAASQATTPAAQSSTLPASAQTAQGHAHVHHTVNSSVSSASSYGSSSSNTHGYASSMTSQTHHGYIQRSYEDCISPAVGKIILPAALRNNNTSSAAPREKNSLTPMHVHLPKTGTLTGGPRPPPQINAVASSSRNVIDNFPPAAVDPESEDEELIRGYKPRKFVDVKKMIREEQDRVHRERLKELPTIPFPVAVGDTAPLRIRKKASQL